MRGIYVIWSQDRTRAYVGESADCERRLLGKHGNQEHSVAISLGCTWELIRPMPGSTKRERLQAEAEVATDLKTQGVLVVSSTASEASRQKNMRAPATVLKLQAATRRWWAGLSPEKRAQVSERYSARTKAMWARMTPAERRERTEPMRAGVTASERSDRIRRGWVTRRRTERRTA